MPRQPKPYVHRGWYVSNLGGQRHKLCREEEGMGVARDALLDLLNERRRSGGRSFPRLTVAELVALFLDSTQVERTDSTYRNHRRWLEEFCQEHGRRLVSDVAPIDGQNFKNDLCRRTWKVSKDDEPPRPYKPKTVNHALMALKRCWNWAIDGELIADRNPFAKIPFLPTEGRQRVMTDEEFQGLLRHSADLHFRQILLTLRYTGARPGELRALTWDMVNFASHTFVLSRHKTSRTLKTPVPRVIAFPPCVEAMLRWRLRTYGRTERVFLNAHGSPWSKCRLIERMSVVRRRAGIAPDGNGEQLVLYTARHTFLTAAAASGSVNGPQLQQLAGHASPAMTAKYVHLGNTDLYQANLKATESLRPKRPAPGQAAGQPARPELPAPPDVPPGSQDQP